MPHSCADERLRFRDLARERGAHFALVVCGAPADVLRARVAARAAAGTDPSEAGLDVLERQFDWYEAPGADEEAWAHHVDTAQGMVEVEAACEHLGQALLAAAGTRQS